MLFYSCIDFRILNSRPSNFGERPGMLFSEKSELSSTQYNLRIRYHQNFAQQDLKRCQVWKFKTYVSKKARGTHLLLQLSPCKLVNENEIIASYLELGRSNPHDSKYWRRSFITQTIRGEAASRHRTRRIIFLGAREIAMQNMAKTQGSSVERARPETRGAKQNIASM